MKTFMLIFIMIIGLIISYFIYPKKYLYIPINPKKTLQLEIASSLKEKKRGLMYRTYLAPHEGMLFIYPQPGQYAIWMKNTLISLDLIWLDENKKIIHYLDNVPICPKDPCPIYTHQPHLYSKYIIEINHGLRNKLHLQIGQTLDF